tara:strand:- start:73 stop:315 length:243 start_codon:yes stop_codon:yes gene_type:complete
MKRFLFVTLFASLLIPTVAKAESYKLLVKVREVRSVSTSVLTMASKEACEEGKKKVLDEDNWDGSFGVNSGVAAICIKSK